MNNNPVLDPIIASSMIEGAIQTVNISAMAIFIPRQVTFSFENLPAFGVFTSNGNKTAQIIFSQGL
ncbi:MAG: hypothetical protein U5K79_19170 [Cyclobacteriaceae bacterium]|nr:hypothetical protein [Cyclobacteriaceae bacterium]